MATAAAAREPDEGEVPAARRRREGRVRCHWEMIPHGRAGGLFIGGHLPSGLPVPFATLSRLILLLLRAAVLYPVPSPEINLSQVPGQADPIPYRANSGQHKLAPCPG